MSYDDQWEAELSYWDSYEDYYYEGDYYYYDWEEREDPCSESYYGKHRSVARNILASDLGIIAKSWHGPFPESGCDRSGHNPAAFRSPGGCFKLPAAGHRKYPDRRKWNGGDQSGKQTFHADCTVKMNNGVTSGLTMVPPYLLVVLMYQGTLSKRV